MSLWKWNDVELEIKMSDYAFQEKYEKAFKKMEETETKLQKVGNLTDITKGYCDMFYTLFDDIYGTGTAEKLFEGRKDTEEIDEAYDSWIHQCAKDVETINKRRKARYSKYKVGSRK